jgi:hypothetical protein
MSLLALLGNMSLLGRLWNPRWLQTTFYTSNIFALIGQSSDDMITLLFRQK